jgi:hypothetical protein
MLRLLALTGGGLIVLATLMSVVATLIVPRDTPARIASLVAHVYMPAFRWFARVFRSYEGKDRWLSFQAPWFLLTLLATWLVLLAFGYTLITWSITTLDFTQAFREAGSSILTLGFASTETTAATLVDFFAAASGLGVVALLIGYLPVLYGAFNRRERTVTLLESRAGSPAWGPEILWRHQRVGILDSLPDLFEDWEKWCADVAESHSSYPVLLFFRSPDPLRSWLTGLLAVLDAAALYNALCPMTAPSQLRLCIRMGFVSLRTLADALGVPFDPDPRPDGDIELTYDEYLRGVQRLVEIEFPMERSPEEAWPHFKGWRVNYEEVALGLADRVAATPGPWAGTRRVFGDLVIGTRRPVDRTPNEPGGTKFTEPGAYEES